MSLLKTSPIELNICYARLVKTKIKQTNKNQTCIQLLLSIYLISNLVCQTQETIYYSNTKHLMKIKKNRKKHLKYKNNF